MDAELAGLARSIEDARKRGDEPRAKALEARVVRVKARLSGAPAALVTTSELAQLNRSIDQAREAGDEPRVKALEERRGRVICGSSHVTAYLGDMSDALSDALADAPTARLPES